MQIYWHNPDGPRATNIDRAILKRKIEAKFLNGTPNAQLQFWYDKGIISRLSQMILMEPGPKVNKALKVAIKVIDFSCLLQRRAMSNKWIEGCSVVASSGASQQCRGLSQLEMENLQ